MKMDLIICLFLSGLLIICDGLHVLGPSGPLIIQPGGSVMLPCYVEDPIPLEELEVEWRRTGSETLVHLFQEGESRPESQDLAYSGRASFFTEEVQRGNFSLLLTNLTTKDAGVYRCSVYRQQETGQTSVKIKEIGLHVRGPSGPLNGKLGGSVMLPCYVEDPIPLQELEVAWKRTDSQKLVHLFQDGESRPEAQDLAYSGRASFITEEVQRGNFSLLLTKLTIKDAGVYNCFVYRQQETGQTSSEIKEIERLVVTGGHVISGYVGEDITLNCSVDSHIPLQRLEVSWKKVNQQIPVLIFQEGEVRPESTHERYRDRVEFFGSKEIQKGNFPLRLKNVGTEDKGLYICEVLSGEFAANTIVEVQQLGYPSLHKVILVLCMLALLVAVLLSYPACTSYQDYSGRALHILYTSVCCPNIAMSLAFILWGVIEGFFTEAATCSALNLLRIIPLFCVAPYSGTFKENLQTFIQQSAFALEYAVITALAYSGLLMRIWHLYQDNKTTGVMLVMILLLSLSLLCLCSLYQGLQINVKKEDSWLYASAELVNIVRGVVVSATFTFNIGLAFLTVLPVCLSFVRCQVFLNSRSKVLIWMSAMIILEVINASSSVYVHYFSLDALETHQEREGLTCVTVYLYVLTGMVLFEHLFIVYGRNGTDTVGQRTGHFAVYMLGAMGLIFVNSIALAVELILKAKNGERTVKDLRVILLPAECVFALCWLMLQISAFWRINRKELMDDLKDLGQLCRCKQASVDSPVQNLKLQTLQSTESAPASQRSAS